jgi:regulation of enolase protein 1 (concanavalin A-like superfamily)
MRLIQSCIALAVFCLLSVTVAEAACTPSGNVLFQDQFHAWAPSWGHFPNYDVTGGKLVIHPPAGNDTWAINTASHYKDVEVCVEMTAPPPVVKNNCGGVVFWAADYDNFYSLQVSTDGQAAVWRRQKGKWLNQVAWQGFAAVHTNANQVNEIRVTTTGNKAELFVNGELFKEVTGQPPKGGSEVGLITCSPNDASARIDFGNFIVSGPGGGPPIVASGGADHGGAFAASGSCKAPDKALFQDPFAELAETWGTSDNYNVEGGKLVIQPPAGFNTATINNASVYDNVETCVEMTMPPPLAKGNCGGIIFWASDYDNYYSLQVSTDRTVAVWRRQKGKWLSQISAEDFAAVHTTAGEINLLSVATAGNKARFLINGQPFKELTGQPPDGGSQVGLLACSPNDASARVEFGNFIVSGPGGGHPIIASGGAPDVAPSAVSAACKATDKTLFQDAFAELAPSWGTYDNYHVESGKLVIQPPAGFNTATINNASLYDDVDICVEMTAPPPLTKDNCGSVIFWAVDYDNYYSLQISTDGTAAVWRRQKGKWLNQISWRDFSAVHATAGQVNTLRVMTAGNKARFFVNGQPFKTLTGQAPDGGSQVGLLACSPNDASARVEFRNFIVSNPGGTPVAGDQVAENKVDEKPVPPEVKPVPPEVKPVPPVVKPVQPVQSGDQGVVAPQGRRVALVMGIGAYKAVPPLVNPPRDAAAIASELHDMGYEVTHLDDLDKTSMRKALEDFEDKASGAAVALVYFAGHGMEVNGVNYLVPADAVLARASSIDDDAVSLPRVMLAVEHAQLRIVLLDACRNNPFPMVGADGSRGISRGLARIDEKEVPKSTVIVFAAKDGATAEDGDGQHSPFAKALLANLNNPELEINMLIRSVTDQVETETGGAQEPFVYAHLTRAQVYLARH